MQIINKCQVDFSYKLSKEGVIVNDTVLSNDVITQILDEKLEILHYADKQKTCRFDILTYTIVIINKSLFDLKCLLLKNIIPKETRYIENSLIINNKKESCVDFNNGILIKQIDKNSKIKITFMVLVEDYCCDEYLESFSVIEYPYIYNVEKIPCIMIKESDKFKVSYEDKTFNQFSITNYIDTYECVQKILNLETDVQIIGTKIIRNCKSNLLNMLVIGKIEYNIMYQSEGRRCNVSDVFGFSSLISVPIGVNLSNQVEDICLEIEDVSINLLNEKSILLNSTMLMFY